MRPDVTLISPYPRLGSRHDGDSGVASYTANLAHALAARGARVTVVAPELAGEAATGNDGPVQVRRAFRAGRAGAVPAALAAARATGAPVSHLQHELFLYSGATGLPGTIAALGVRRGARSAQRTVITMHQVVDPSAVTRAYTSMHRVAVPAPVARVAIGAVQQVLPSVADAVLVHEPAFRQLVPGAQVVPHGIEVPPAATRTRAEVRADLGLPADGLLALCFGFLAPYKGLEIALTAGELAGREVRMVVAGGQHPRLAAQGDDYDVRLQQRYGGSASFTGYVADADVSRWFQAADVLLLCYPEPHASSGPLALALAHRTPVLLSERLAATVGADPALAVRSDPSAWADRLRVLAGSITARDQLRGQVALLAADRTWPAIADRHLELYREVSDDCNLAAADHAMA